MKSDIPDTFEKLQTEEDIDLFVRYSIDYHYEVATAAYSNWHIWDEELRRYYVNRVCHYLKLIDLSTVDDILNDYSFPHIVLNSYY